MADLPPTAIEAVARAIYERSAYVGSSTPDWGHESVPMREACRETATAALTVAAPIIERQVRERAVIDAQSALSGALHRLTLLGRGDTEVYRAVRDYGGDIIAAIAATPAPIPPTSENQCEACGRLTDCWAIARKDVRSEPSTGSPAMRCRRTPRVSQAIAPSMHRRRVHERGRHHLGSAVVSRSRLRTAGAHLVIARINRKGDEPCLTTPAPRRSGPGSRQQHQGRGKS